jgi:glutamate dehydrogenase (NAD(P)+)
MTGFLVIDNTILGPGKGGIRMTPDTNIEEVWRLARTMTWKNALFDLPFGGAKAGIIWPPKGFGKKELKKLKKQYLQTFARAIKIFTPKKYVAGPDVNTGEREMEWFVQATKNWRSATGKPANLCMKIFGKESKVCGIPHEFGATGFGVAQATKIAADLKKIDLKKAKIAIEGFGNVGSFTFKYLKKLGAKIVALADKGGAIYNKNGFNQKKLEKIKKSQEKSVKEYPEGEKLAHHEIFNLPVDILVLASVTDVVNQKNKNKIKAKIIVEGANIPMKEEIENELFQKGILIVPDFLANAGGVISSYSEWRGYNPKKMLNIVEKKIKTKVFEVLKKALKENKNPREIALKIAKEKILKKIHQ